MRLKDFILRDMEQILQRWETFARTRIPAAEQMPSLSLRDHGPEILQAIMADLARPQTPAEQLAKSMGLASANAGAPHTAAHTHALLRVRSGFDIEQMASEYRALRASVLLSWMEACLPHPPHVDDIIRFNEAIDQALAESIASFTAEVTRARNLLLGMLSHDLRSPLQVIQITARHLHALGAEGAVGVAAERMIRSGARMQRLLDDLIDFNRTELGLGIRVSPRTVDLGQVCREELEQLKAAHPEHEVQLDIAGDCSGRWDPGRVQQLLNNLVLNAFHYGTREDPVRVAVTGADSAVRISVTNSGKSIDDETLAHLFEPLRRGRDDAGSNNAGLGLGLYISSEITRAHQGHIAVTSQQNETVFTVDLPKL